MTEKELRMQAEVEVCGDLLYGRLAVESFEHALDLAMVKFATEGRSPTPEEIAAGIKAFFNKRVEERIVELSAATAS